MRVVPRNNCVDSVPDCLKKQPGTFFIFFREFTPNI